MNIITAIILGTFDSSWSVKWQAFILNNTATNSQGSTPHPSKRHENEPA
jgi:hypothetical protein